MAKINVRSPFYVNLTATRLTSVDMELWVYTGTQTTDRTSSNGSFFQLTSTAVYTYASNTSNVTFEVSEIAKDFIQQNFTGDYYNNNVWIDYRTRNYIGGVAQSFTSWSSYRGFYGYGYFQDGANPSLELGWLQSNLIILKSPTEPLKIPVDTELVNNVSFYENGVLVYSHDVTSSVESDQQIEYIQSDGSSFVDLESRVIADGGVYESSYCIDAFEGSANFDADTVYINSISGDVTVVKIKNIEECKYEPMKLTFENRFGALQDLWFFKRTNKTLSTKKEMFKRNISVNGAYNVSNHQAKILTKNGSEKLSLNTGFYPEIYNDIFKEVQLSEDVWITINNQVLPINVESSGVEYKTQLNDKLINYTVDVSFAFDTINNIR